MEGKMAVNTHKRKVERNWLKNGLLGVSSLLSTKCNKHNVSERVSSNAEVTQIMQRKNYHSLPTADCRWFHPDNKIAGVVKNSTKIKRHMLIRAALIHQYFGLADKFSQIMLSGDGARLIAHSLDFTAVDIEEAL